MALFVKVTLIYTLVETNGYIFASCKFRLLFVYHFNDLSAVPHTSTVRESWDCNHTN